MNDETDGKAPAPAEAADLDLRDPVVPHVSAQPYIDAGLPVFPVEYQGKQPFLFGRDRFAWRNATLPLTEIPWPTPSNIGLRLDRHIELDPDNPIASWCADRLFASMPTFVWGRKSRPGKRLYVQASTCEISYSGHYFLSSGEKVATIEVKAGAGHYTILAPGAHKSGETIEGTWCEPAVVEMAQVLEQAKLVNLMCMLREFWTQGHRNALTVALARVLHQRGDNVSDEMAANIVRSVAACAGGDDPQKRYSEALAAARRADAGKHVYGLPKLIEILGQANVNILLDAIGVTEEQAWDDPENPWDLTPAAPIPDDVLPPTLAARARNLSDSTGCQYPHAVLYGIAAVSIAAGARWRIRANEEFWQPLSLYGAVVDISGGGKSIAARMLDPLHDIERKRELEYLTELRTWQKSDKDGRGPKPEPPWVTTVDATIEGILRANRNNPQGGGVVPDEVASVLLGANQYKQGNGSDDEAFKMIYDGKPFRSTRKGEDASNYVAHPCITIFGGIQPERLNEVLLNDGNVSSGTAARFCLSCYHPPETVRAKDGARYDALAATAWRDLLFALRDSRYPHWESVSDPCKHECHDGELRLSTDAARTFNAWGDEFAAVVHSTPPPLRQVWSKYRGFVLRLAGIFHLAESVVKVSGPDMDGNPNISFAFEREVSGSCMERALRFVIDYLLPHSRRLYAVADEAGGRTAGLLLAERVLARGDAEVSVREVEKANLRWVANRATITAAMRFLESIGWGRISNSRRGGGGGRKGAKLVINPKVHDGRFANAIGGAAPPLAPR